jgi:hypothetical protein
MNIWRKTSRLLMPDIFVWAFIFLVPIYLAPTPRHTRPEGFNIVDFLPYLFSCILLVVVYYTNYHVLVPRYYVRRRYVVYFLFLIGILWLLLLVPEVDHLFRDHHPLVLKSSNGAVRSGSGGGFARIFRLTYFESQVLVMGLMVIIVSTFLRITRQLRRTEDEKKGAELAYLKAQINPHFLFNTLNSIYLLAYRKSELTAPAIVKLSALMRYVITDAQEDLVPLSKELEYISNYIELQRLRLTETTSVHYHVTGDAEGKLISPLIFLPFIENAFKYGVNPEKNSDIRVEFMISDQSVQMEVANSIVTTQEVTSERIGVGNSRERLERMYHGSYLLNMTTREDKFTVSLNINFQ